ncbi:hypothetical protein [uncultured Thiodictyon sp.]|uniref:hypothetical protein n=1 Tax=uncultured Thiodictyon sp. TaxID=1846217 RepID=UPI0025FF8B96|nr:hypothetical protein [uncultured Thiodictyon sp.]
MPLKSSIIASTAAMIIALPGVLYAQNVIDQGVIEGREAKATGETVAPPPTPAEQYMHMKVDEATAAEAKAHANPTAANLQARSKAEQDASEAFEAVQATDKTDQLRR